MASDTTTAQVISVIIPAYNEQGRVGATVSAARAIPNVGEVIVVDDGSRDGTVEEAGQAGATVIAAPHRGKGAALRRGVGAARGNVMLLLDADLGATAGNADVLIEPVRAGRADMTIAVLPAPGGRAGFGIALAAARASLWLLTGRVFAAPLSGQRCIAASLARVLPFARGFGTEVAATTDAAALGARVAEVPAALSHAATGRTLAGFVHRGRQFASVIAACAPRALYPLGPTARPAPARRWAVAVCAWVILAAIGLALHPWLFAAAAAAGLAIGIVAVSTAINAITGLVRGNYLGRRIPAAGGILFPSGPLAVGGWAAAHGHPAMESLALTAIGAAVMAVAGLADDMFGSRGVSGFRGHIGALVRGRVTTGALKAVVGVAVGVLVGWRLAHGNVAMTALNAAVIALSTNLINLLDLRPGRAIKGFVLLGALAALADARALYAVAPIGVIAFAFAPLDLGGRAMMGDAGANSLGAVAGIALAAALPVWAKLVLCAFLVGIHAYSERRSLTEVISRVSALRWLDRLGRPEEDSMS